MADGASASKSRLTLESLPSNKMRLQEIYAILPEKMKSINSYVWHSYNFYNRAIAELSAFRLCMGQIDPKRQTTIDLLDICATRSEVIEESYHEYLVEQIRKALELEDFKLLYKLAKYPKSKKSLVLTPVEENLWGDEESHVDEDSVAVLEQSDYLTMAREKLLLTPEGLAFLEEQARAESEAELLASYAEREAMSFARALLGESFLSEDAASREAPKAPEAP